MVGWREWVSLPGLEIPAIKAKIDTGARTSALHAFALEPFEENGQLKIRFGIHPLTKRPEVEIYCLADVTDQRIVTDSGGHREARYFIRTPISIGTNTWPIEISLTNRDNMLFRMLVGRTAMADCLLVDPGASYLTGRELAKVYPKHSSSETSLPHENRHPFKKS